MVADELSPDSDLLTCCRGRCTNGAPAQPQLDILTPNRSPADISVKASAEPSAHVPHVRCAKLSNPYEMSADVRELGHLTGADPAQ